MPVNSTLASFSDLSFKIAFVLYVVALLVTLISYFRTRLLQEERRALAAAPAEKKVLAGVAAGGSGAGTRSADATAGTSGTDGTTGTDATAGENPAGSTREAAESADAAEADATTTDATTTGTATGGSSRLKKWAADPAPLTPAELALREHSLDTLATAGQAVVYLGILFHLACVVLRGLSAHRFPWGNLYEYVAVASLVAMIVAAIVLAKREYRIMWPWILTPIIALLFYGGMKLYAASAPVVPSLQSYWFPIHVSVVSAGAGFGLISGMCSLMYVLRIRQPRGSEHGVVGALVAPLPSAKKLDRLAYRTAVIAFPIFGLGVIFGAIWAESAWGRFWGWDPKETMSFVTWVAYAAYLHARATSGWRDVKASWINIFAFACMVFNLFFINLVVSGLHSYAGLN